MKKMKYLFMICATAVMSLSSCMENMNEWEVEEHPNGNRTWEPTAINVTKGAKLLKLTGINAANATSYVAQVSTIDFEKASSEDIIEVRYDGTLSSKDTMEVKGLKPVTAYYLRVKACATGKEDSNWIQYVSSSGTKTVKTLAVSSDTIMFAAEYAEGTCPSPVKSALNSEGKNAITLSLVVDGANNKFKITESTSAKKFYDGEDTFNGGFFRLQSAKSSNDATDANHLEIVPAYKGKLSIYTVASSSDITKITPLTISQNGVELDSIEDLPHSGNGEAVVVDVVAGSPVIIKYPMNAINFYGAKLEYDPQDQ